MPPLKRVTDKDFCGYTGGVLASTRIDRHGERFAESMLRNAKQTLIKEPEKRIFNVHHDRSQPVGEIVFLNMNKEDGVVQLSGIIGIWEGNEDVLKKLDSGELGGFSMSAEYYRNTEEAEWNEGEVNIEVIVDGYTRSNVDEIFKRQDIGYRGVVQKSADSLAFFQILGSVSATISALMTVYQWWKSNPEGQETGHSIEIQGENNTVIFAGDGNEDAISDSKNLTVVKGDFSEERVRDELEKIIDTEDD